MSFNNSEEAETNKHYFDKIFDRNVLGEVFTFLNLSNSRTLMNVCKKFRHVLMRNDSFYLRSVGAFSYGLNQQKDFECDPTKDYIKRSIKSNLRPVVVMALLHDLNLLATSGGCYEEGVKFWDLSSAILVKELNYHPPSSNGFIQAMCYIEHVHYLACTYDGGVLVLYQLDLTTRDFAKPLYRKNLCYMEEITNIIYIGISNTQAHLVTLQQNKYLKLNYLKGIDINTGQINKCATISKKLVTCMYYFTTETDEKFLIFALENLLVLKLYSNIDNDFEELVIDKTLYGHNDVILAICYHKSGHNEYIISGGVDNEIIIWNMHKNSQDLKYKVMRQHTHNVNGIIYLEALDVLASYGKDGNIILWNFEDNDMKMISKHNFKKEIYKLEFNEQTEELFIGSWDRDLKSIFFNEELSKVQNTRYFNGHAANIKHTQIDFVNQKLITYSVDDIMKIWDYKTIRLLYTLEIKMVESFIILNDDLNTLIKINGLNGKVEFFNIKTEKIYFTFTEPLKALSIINVYDGVSFLIGFNNSEIGFYNYFLNQEEMSVKKNKSFIHAPGNLVEEKPADYRTDLRITKLVNLDYSKKLIASAANDGSICLFDLNKYTKRYIPSKENTKVLSLAVIQNSGDVFRIVYSYDISSSRLYVYDVLNNCHIGYHDVNYRISALDRLSDDFLLVSYSNNIVEILDIMNNYKLIKKIELPYSQVKPIFYLKDGYRFLTVCGGANEGYSIDIISFKF
jgi:WD40 repeat protein